MAGFTSAEPGEAGTLRLKLPGGRSLALGVTMVRRDRGRELRWIGGLPGLFLGEHYWRLDEAPDGRVCVSHGEEFSGLVGAPMARALRPFFDVMYERDAAALARAASTR